MTFETLGLSPALLRALAENSYTTPTPIQLEAIPLALAGHDLLGGAQTGTGKTAAFSLPLLQRLAKETPPNGPRKPRALILTPTRELAAQVEESLREYGKYSGLRTTVIFVVGFMLVRIPASIPVFHFAFANNHTTSTTTTIAPRIECMAVAASFIAARRMTPAKRMAMTAAMASLVAVCGRMTLL